MKIFAAPIQGYTTAPWHHFHAELFGGVDTYFSPFLRVEKNAVRRHDIKAITSDFNGNHHLIPQIIFRDMEEFNILVDAVAECGYNEVNLNMGCPFPPQVKHGRGAAVVADVALLERLRDEMLRRTGVSFSVKMRLGVNDPRQWLAAVDILNAMPLAHVTLHPRVARQQYGGDIYLDEFAQFLALSKHSVVFNGDIAATGDIDALIARFPTLHGVMIGRGLLARPSLAHEYLSGERWSDQHLLERIMSLHRSVYDHYREVACGDAQCLSLVKPFWDYMEPLIGHKPAKLIKKATTIQKYNDAVSSISF